MGRPPNTEERRLQIVKGMAEVVARKGYDGASISEIAEAAGLASGLIHYHFASKLEIFVQLVDYLATTLEQRLRARLDDAGDAQAKLRAYIDVHLALGADADPRLAACWVSVGAEAIRNADVRVAYRPAIEADLTLLEQLVRDCLAEPARKHARAIAAGLFAAIEGYFVLTAADPTLVPKGSAARTVRLMAEGLIAQVAS